MAASILVTYATRYGSTQQAAEQIATTLRELGFEVDLQPAHQVHTLEGYRAIVLGAPLEIGKWHGDAHHLLSHFRKALMERPLAIFALGPLHNVEEEMKSAREQLDKELKRYTWLKPIAIQVFVGKLDPTKLHFPVSMFMKAMPASNEMDEASVREWAGKLPSLIELAAPYVHLQPEKAA